jgi:hypothetical protein
VARGVVLQGVGLAIGIRQAHDARVPITGHDERARRGGAEPPGTRRLGREGAGIVDKGRHRGVARDQGILDL